MKILYVFVLIMFLFSTGCNSEKFLKYNYDAEELAESAAISGTVINKFTRRGVAFAAIEFEDQKTTADSVGGYFLNYILSPDAGQNLAISIRIDAVNYFSLDTSLIVFPEDTRIDFSMEYAAPIIEAVVIVNSQILQALVRDYQGTGNIDSVKVRLHFKNSNGTTVRTEDIPLAFLGEQAPNVGRFQAFTPPDYPPSETHFIIGFAKDKDGFSDERPHSYNPKRPDMLLFPPDNG